MREWQLSNAVRYEGTALWRPSSVLKWAGTSGRAFLGVSRREGRALMASGLYGLLLPAFGWVLAHERVGCADRS
jgi:hypothetical protein